MSEERRRVLMSSSAKSTAFTAETGTFTLESNITVAAAGTTIDVGFSGKPDILIVWLDAETFGACTSLSNNRWYRFALIKNEPQIVNTIPEIRYNNTTSVQNVFADAEYILSISQNINTCSATDNGYGITGMTYGSSNVTKNSINDDGTITVARYNSSASAFLAGTYHYIAITGINIGLW